MKPLLALVCGLALATGAAAADSLIIPFAANAAVGGKLLRTTLLVSNRAEIPRSFSVWLTPASENTAVALLPRTFLAPRGLAGCCLELAGLVPAGGLGMLEIRGAPQIRVSSILEVVESGVVVGRIEIPALRGADLDPGIRPFGAELELDTDTVLAGFVHLSESNAAGGNEEVDEVDEVDGVDEPAICGVDVLKPEGGLAGFGVLVPPRTLVLENVGDRLGEHFPGTTLHFGEFQCLQNRVFPFLVVVDGGSPVVTFVTPARP